MTRDERREQLEIARKVSQILAHLEECDGRVVLYTWRGLVELTEEVERFERGKNNGQL